MKIKHHVDIAVTGLHGVFFKTDINRPIKDKTCRVGSMEKNLMKVKKKKK